MLWTIGHLWYILCFMEKLECTFSQWASRSEWVSTVWVSKRQVQRLRIQGDINNLNIIIIVDDDNIICDLCSPVPRCLSRPGEMLQVNSVCGLWSWKTVEMSWIVNLLKVKAHLRNLPRRQYHFTLWHVISLLVTAILTLAVDALYRVPKEFAN